MNVGRRAAASASLGARGTGSDWLLRHARHDTARWERPSVASSTAAAETIVRVLAVGGPSCWETATELYAGGLATRSIGRRGAVAQQQRHGAIVHVMTALGQGNATVVLRGLVARRIARDVTLPQLEATREEHEAAAAACAAILRELLASGEYMVALRCAERWAKRDVSPAVAQRVLHTLLASSTGDSSTDAMCRMALLRGGILQRVEMVTGTPGVAALLSLREGGEGETDRCLARWCVDAALYMKVCPWTACFAHLPPSDASSEVFYEEMLACWCTHRRLPMPAAAVGALPGRVLSCAIADVMRCCFGCRDELTESTMRRLRDVVSAFCCASVRPHEGAVMCLDLLYQLSNGESVAQDVLWWRDHLQRYRPTSVTSAVAWVELCNRVGATELVLQPPSSAPSYFPLLVVQASQSASAAVALFEAVRHGSANLPEADDIPCAAACNVLLLCRDGRSTPAVHWVLRRCKDHKGIARFILDQQEQHHEAAANVLRALLEPEHADVFAQLSKLLGDSPNTWLSRVVSLAAQHERWVVALRCVAGMAAPSIGHLHVAFLSLTERSAEPFAVGLDFLWSDDSHTSLHAEVSPPQCHIDSDRWEAALRLMDVGARHMKKHSNFLQLYAHAISRATATNCRVHAEVEAHLARIQFGGDGAAAATTITTPRSAREELKALVKGKDWAAACSLVPQAGPTRGLVTLLAYSGRWAEAARLVAAHRREAWLPLVVRGARVAGAWQAALWAVEQTTAAGMRLHYAAVAELLACCTSAEVPLEAIQLWLRSHMGGAAAHALFGLKNGVAAANGRQLCTTHAELLLVMLSSSHSAKEQWMFALELLTSHVRQRGDSPSSRVFHTTFAILQQAGRWRESLQLLRFQHSLGVLLTTRAARQVIDTLPASEWQAALMCVRDVPRGDAGLVNRVVPRILPFQWECALRLLVDHRVMTIAVTEQIVSCDEVPLHMRLQAWHRLLPSLPVSMKHRAAAVYLRLSLAVSDAGTCSTHGVDGLRVIERSVRGLRHDYRNYAAFVYHRGVLHRCWCDARLDPAVGVAAFRSLSDIARVDAQCEVSASALEQLSDLVERMGP